MSEQILVIHGILEAIGLIAIYFAVGFITAKFLIWFTEAGGPDNVGEWFLVSGMTCFTLPFAIIYVPYNVLKDAIEIPKRLIIIEEKIDKLSKKRKKK